MESFVSISTAFGLADRYNILVTRDQESQARIVCIMHKQFTLRELKHISFLHPFIDTQFNENIKHLIETVSVLLTPEMIRILSQLS
jgi:DNA recombination-dependent growth factor C